MPNRLAGATSPYLRQHADNPVDWHPWGPEALALARDTDRPILLSIGYSACHWCHVMAHESFEDPAIAALMNAGFVNIKVDREERPDLDAIYMDAVQAVSGHGGWPLTVFLTPSGRPFFGGTYFPPVPRHGMSSFPDLLTAIAEAWRDRRPDIERSAEAILDALRRASPVASRDALTPDLVISASLQIMRGYDAASGGFGGAPKFPSAPVLAFLLGRWARDGDVAPRDAVLFTLDAMATGGLRDQIGGGFHRYCVDADWTIPHFEKMLYDNAQLARLYLEAWQATGEARFRAVAEDTLKWLLADLRGTHGAFLAARDADTAEGEGAYYSWTPDEVAAVLDPETAGLAAAWYGIVEGGNFEGGRTVPTTRANADALAQSLGMERAELDARLETARAGLRAARDRRAAPAADDKVLADWNGLAIDALARAGGAFNRPDYVAAAEGALRFVLAALRHAPATGDGGLAHSWRAGTPGAPAFLEDYAALGGACLSLYEATFETAWLEAAERLVEGMIARFADEGGGFRRTGPEHEPLVLDVLDLADAASPSGNALAADLLLRAAALLDRADWSERAASIFRLARPQFERAPQAFGALLAALDGYLSGSREVAIVGPAEGAAELLAVVRAQFLPGTVVAWSAAPTGMPPLLSGRTASEGRATAFVCRSFACRRPVTSPDDLLTMLAAEGHVHGRGGGM